MLSCLAFSSEAFNSVISFSNALFVADIFVPVQSAGRFFIDIDEYGDLSSQYLGINWFKDIINTTCFVSFENILIPIVVCRYEDDGNVP